MEEPQEQCRRPGLVVRACTSPEPKEEGQVGESGRTRFVYRHLLRDNLFRVMLAQCDLQNPSCLSCLPPFLPGALCRLNQEKLEDAEAC